MASRVVALASGAGSNVQALLDRPDTAPLLRRVVADVPGAPVLERAGSAGVDTVLVDRDGYGGRAAWEAALAEAVAAVDPHLVVLAGFMRILSGDFVRRWPLLNVHPSLLPAFPGARSVRAALEHGVKVTGVTVHFVAEEVDAGPIVSQEAVDVGEKDTVETLHARIRAVEHRLLPDAVAAFCAGRLVVEGRHVRIKP